jgi:hypothetical protein
LDQRGSILEVAHEVSRIMRRAGIPGVVIGGISVVLHRLVRSTKDVDVFLDQPLQSSADLLTAERFAYDESRREFSRGGVPLHLFTREQVLKPPKETVEIDGIITVDLADLIEMKLASGTRKMLRAQDLADAIGLIRQNGLTDQFARRLDNSLRPAYRKLAKAIAQERRG